MAYVDLDHPNYYKACSILTELDDLERGLVTTSQEVFAVHQWLRDQFGAHHARYFLNRMDQAARDGYCWIIPGSPEMETKSWNFLREHQKYNLTLEEALNAMVLVEYRIKRLFSFNQNYGFLTEMDEDIKVFPNVAW